MLVYAVVLFGRLLKPASRLLTGLLTIQCACLVDVVMPRLIILMALAGAKFVGLMLYCSSWGSCTAATVEGGIARCRIIAAHAGARVMAGGTWPCVDHKFK